MIYYVCRYTPIELFAGFSEECQRLNPVTQTWEISDRLVHQNICSFCRTLIQDRMVHGETLVLTNCCDSIRRTYDVLKSQGKDVYFLELPHKQDECSRLIFRDELIKLIEEYSQKKGQAFDQQKFYQAFKNSHEENVPYLGVLGARINSELYNLISYRSPLPVKNMTCTGKRKIGLPPHTRNLKELMVWYAGELLGQIPCMRMTDISSRKTLSEDPNLQGMIYHTVKFCDFYEFENHELQSRLKVPMVHIETDWLQQNSGQITTRLEAFFETLKIHTRDMQITNINKDNSACDQQGSYYAGIDIGSTTTNVVILDNKRNIVSSSVVPTGSRPADSSHLAFEKALAEGKLKREQISNTVSTGYGRANITFRGKDVTEITCHAKGAFFLNPLVRTVIDVGGQDSKVICLDKNGAVRDFVMNDKCAAGTGRFLEMMARSLELDLSEMSIRGLTWDEEITISSMCSVFAESEVISLIAGNKKIEDIIHGINQSVASKLFSLMKKVEIKNEYMITGGVAKNIGVVLALESMIGSKIFVFEESVICGALGAALIAAE